MPNDPNPAPNGPDKPAEGEPTTGSTGTPGNHGGQPTGTGNDGQGADVATERAAREAAEKRAADAEAEAARLRGEAKPPEDEPKPGTELDALRTEIRGEFRQQLARAEVRAAAAGKLKDPADALALLDVAALVGKGGDIDQAAISAAVDKLVKDKPYLAAESAAETGPAPWGDVGAGQRSSGEPEPASPLDRLRRAYDDK